VPKTLQVLVMESDSFLRKSRQIVLRGFPTVNPTSSARFWALYSGSKNLKRPGLPEDRPSRERP